MVFSNKIILPNALSSDQHEILAGHLLGDGSLELTNKSPRFKVERSAKDIEYLNWSYSYFKEFCKSPIKRYSRFDKRYNKWNETSYFRTRVCPIFLNYYQKWYPKENNFKKNVPEDLQLTPLIMAVWFADDGCPLREIYNNMRVKLSTESFGYKGTKLLCDKLQEYFDIEFLCFEKHPGKNIDQYFIQASNKASLKFLKVIDPYILSMNMGRKREFWDDLNLDYDAEIGRPTNTLLNFCKFVLDKKDFSFKEIELGLPLNKGLRGMINKFVDEKYLIRYESTEKFNLYRYTVTPAGIDYFSARFLNTKIISCSSNTIQQN